jgi:hypothetical protein
MAGYITSKKKSPVETARSFFQDVWSGWQGTNQDYYSNQNIAYRQPTPQVNVDAAKQAEIDRQLNVYDPAMGANILYNQTNPRGLYSNPTVSTPTLRSIDPYDNSGAQQNQATQGLQRGEQDLGFAQQELDAANQALRFNNEQYLKEAGLYRGEAEYGIGQVRQAVGQKKTRLGEDIATRRTQNQSNYDQATQDIFNAFKRSREDASQQNVNAERSLRSSYSARGLGDSSFSGEALAKQAENYNQFLSRAGEDETIQRQRAYQTFQDNLTLINRDEARGLSDLDNYLADQEHKFNVQIQQFDFADAKNAEEARQQLAALTRAQEQIKLARQRLHEDTAAAIADIQAQQAYNSQLQAQQAARAPLEALDELTNAISTIATRNIPRQQKNQMLKSLVGTYYSSPQEQEYAYNYYTDWLNATEEAENTGYKGRAYESFTQKYGQPPF